MPLNTPPSFLENEPARPILPTPAVSDPPNKKTVVIQNERGPKRPSAWGW